MWTRLCKYGKLILPLDALGITSNWHLGSHARKRQLRHWWKTEHSGSSGHRRRKRGHLGWERTTAVAVVQVALTGSDYLGPD